MIYAKGHLQNDKVVLTNVKQIDLKTLTAECFLIQINGATACVGCENLNKPSICGGMKLREKLGVPPPITRKRKPITDDLVK